MHYVEWVWKCECVFELHRTWGYGRLSRQPHACTHRSRCDFMALWLHLRSVFSSVFAPGSSPFFLAPITTTFVIWHRDNETANTATPLRNLRKCIQLFGAFLSVTNCIPKAWHHTPPTENTHCKISSLMLRRLAIIYIVGSKTWEAGGNPPPRCLHSCKCAGDNDFYYRVKIMTGWRTSSMVMAIYWEFILDLN